jgi:hypothetical protein
MQSSFVNCTAAAAIEQLRREQGELTAEQQEAVYRHYLTVLQADEEMTRCVEKRSDDNDD